MRSLARIPLVAAAAFMLFTPTASAQVGGTDALGSGNGAAGVVDPASNTVSPVPPSSVEVFASCVIAKQATTAVWFGYRNGVGDRRVALVGPANVVTVNGVAGGANRGQITQFQPGVVDRAFVVTVPVGSTITWTVTPATILGVNDAVVSATNTTSTPPCPTGTGVRSATPQIEGSLVPTVSTAPVNERISNDVLVRSSIRFSANGIVSACSDGGVPLAPKVLWGYDVSPANRNGALIVPAGAPFDALSVDKVLRVDTDATGLLMFERSYQSVRRVVDPQRLSVFGSLQDQINGTAQVAWGYSSISVIADVEARCQFPNGIVKSSTQVWVDPASGSGFDVHTVTDRLTQSTRPAAFCLAPYPSIGCDVRGIGVGPGGARFR